ncbi:DUF2628 domain-containing protein [Mycolicibacterium austroafricanum]|uniref:DUF2628 domain-containing protein n=1 Tax=Mycolicibacterium austroafricanum TaxID=39687 RepID=UPI001CA300C1|nr:DUF2628 domain-containing protein [Mycolicibacterium austroafricanum]QZT62036.1 DUF2628 domain-containing protein [Mycolicibacterium austroafricanum]
MDRPYDVWKLSESWRIRFAYFETYGPVPWTLEARQGYRALSFWDRIRLSSNVSAFLLGPVYFFAKGMWRKGLTLCGLVGASVPAVLFTDVGGVIERVAALIVPVAATTTANYAYYLHVAKNSRSWNPLEGMLRRR